MNLLQLNLEKYKKKIKNQKGNQKLTQKGKMNVVVVVLTKGNQYLFGVKTAKTKKTC